MADRGMPSWESFLSFEEELIARKMTEMTSEEVKRAFERMGIFNTKKLSGREVGYIRRTHTGHDVVIWLTAIRDKQTFRDKNSDAIRILIRKRDSVRYRKDFMRTTRCFTNGKILKYLDVCIERAENAPLCKECKRSMNMVYGQKNRRTWFSCPVCKNPETGKPLGEDFDYRLSKENDSFIKEERKKRRKDRERYQKKRKAEGKEVKSAHSRRKSKYRHTRPENRER